MLQHDNFSLAECERYDRHFKLPVLGVEGQKKLRDARVLCVGIGGLGAPACLYLAAAGVGTLGIVDDDVVELTNLQRQILYCMPDIGQQKTKAAQTQLLTLNPEINIVTYSERLTADNIEHIFSDYDFIMDGSDNFVTHYLINAYGYRLQKPIIFATVMQTSGQCSIFNAAGGPCYCCLFPEPPPAYATANCSEAGVLGVLPGLLGIIQATEVIKLIIQKGEPLIGRLLRVDMLSMRFQEYRLEKNNDCPLCSELQCISYPIFKKEFSVMNSITVEELQTLINECSDSICVLDVRQPDEYAICNIGGQLIPLGELPHRLSELDKNKHIIVHCRSGGRSAQAAQLLSEANFTQVSNLTGGIIAWAEKIDPSLTKY